MGITDWYREKVRPKFSRYLDERPVGGDMTWTDLSNGIGSMLGGKKPYMICLASTGLAGFTEGVLGSDQPQNHIYAERAVGTVFGLLGTGRASLNVGIPSYRKTVHDAPKSRRKRRNVKLRAFFQAMEEGPMVGGSLLGILSVGTYAGSRMVGWGLREGVQYVIPLIEQTFK